MHGYRTSLAGLCGLAVLLLLAAGDARAGVVLWNGSGSNDSTNWAGLGPDGTTIPSPFTATSADGNTITGSFTSGSGQTAVEGVGWTGGFPAGDTLVWTLDPGSGLPSGPLTLNFGRAVLAGGLDIQADAAPGAFTAQVEAFAGATLLGTETISSATGVPVFIGALDTVAEITSLTFDLTSCPAPCSTNDFAVDTLLSENPAVATPEPASLFLFGSALTALGLLQLRRRRQL